MAKVYLSSTVSDLERERRVVLDWLVAAKHQPIHSYRPDSESVRESSLDDVDVCDVYVLILGYRYRFVPPGDNPEGLSATQLEFRCAGECGIPRIALLSTSIPDVSRSDVADPQKLALVLAFREEVAREVLTAEFSDQQSLIRGLSTGVQAELAKLAEQAERANRAARGPRPDIFIAYPAGGCWSLCALPAGRVGGALPKLLGVHGSGLH